jgi:hypothetical protein
MLKFKAQVFRIGLALASLGALWAAAGAPWKCM